MAYERGFPILVVAQRGLREDAFLESTGDVRPFWTDVQTDIRTAGGFLGYLHSWKLDVEAFVAAAASRKQEAAGHVTVASLFTSLRWHDFVGLIGAFLGAVATAATIGYRLGAGEWPLG
jgi:hypothetical protein